MNNIKNIIKKINLFISIILASYAAIMSSKNSTFAMDSATSNVTPVNELTPSNVETNELDQIIENLKNIELSSEQTNSNNENNTENKEDFEVLTAHDLLENKCKNFEKILVQLKKFDEYIRNQNLTEHILPEDLKKFEELKPETEQQINKIKTFQEQYANKTNTENCRDFMKKNKNSKPSTTIHQFTQILNNCKQQNLNFRKKLIESFTKLKQDYLNLSQQINDFYNKNSSMDKKTEQKIKNLEYVANTNVDIIGTILSNPTQSQFFNDDFAKQALDAFNRDKKNLLTIQNKIIAKGKTKLNKSQAAIADIYNLIDTKLKPLKDKKTVISKDVQTYINNLEKQIATTEQLINNALNNQESTININFVQKIQLDVNDMIEKTYELNYILNDPSLLNSNYRQLNNFIKNKFEEKADYLNKVLNNPQISEEIKKNSADLNVTLKQQIDTINAFYNQSKSGNQIYDDYSLFLEKLKAEYAISSPFNDLYKLTQPYLRDELIKSIQANNKKAYDYLICLKFDESDPDVKALHNKVINIINSLSIENSKINKFCKENDIAKVSSKALEDLCQKSNNLFAEYENIYNLTSASSHEVDSINSTPNGQINVYLTIYQNMLNYFNKNARNIEEQKTENQELYTNFNTLRQKIKNEHNSIVEFFNTPNNRKTLSEKAFLNGLVKNYGSLRDQLREIKELTNIVFVTKSTETDSKTTYAAYQKEISTLKQNLKDLQQVKNNIHNDITQHTTSLIQEYEQEIKRIIEPKSNKDGDFDFDEKKASLKRLKQKREELKNKFDQIQHSINTTLNLSNDERKTKLLEIKEYYNQIKNILTRNLNDIYINNASGPTVDKTRELINQIQNELKSIDDFLTHPVEDSLKKQNFVNEKSHTKDDINTKYTNLANTIESISQEQNVIVSAIDLLYQDTIKAIANSLTENKTISEADKKILNNVKEASTEELTKIEKYIDKRNKNKQTVDSIKYGTFIEMLLNEQKHIFKQFEKLSNKKLENQIKQQIDFPLLKTRLDIIQNFFKNTLSEIYRIKTTVIERYKQDQTLPKNILNQLDSIQDQLKKNINQKPKSNEEIDTIYDFTKSFCDQNIEKENIKASISEISHAIGVDNSKYIYIDLLNDFKQVTDQIKNGKLKPFFSQKLSDNLLEYMEDIKRQINKINTCYKSHANDETFNSAIYSKLMSNFQEKHIELIQKYRFSNIVQTLHQNLTPAEVCAHIKTELSEFITDLNAFKISVNLNNFTKFLPEIEKIKKAIIEIETDLNEKAKAENKDTRQQNLYSLFMPMVNRLVDINEEFKNLKQKFVKQQLSQQQTESDSNSDNLIISFQQNIINQEKEYNKLFDDIIDEIKLKIKNKSKYEDNTGFLVKIKRELKQYMPSFAKLRNSKDWHDIVKLKNFYKQTNNMIHSTLEKLNSTTIKNKKTLAESTSAMDNLNQKFDELCNTLFELQNPENEKTEIDVPSKIKKMNNIFQEKSNIQNKFLDIVKNQVDDAVNTKLYSVSDTENSPNLSSSSVESDDIEYFSGDEKSKSKLSQKTFDTDIPNCSQLAKQIFQNAVTAFNKKKFNDPRESVHTETYRFLKNISNYENITSRMNSNKPNNMDILDIIYKLHKTAESKENYEIDNYENLSSNSEHFFELPQLLNRQYLATIISNDFDKMEKSIKNINSLTKNQKKALISKLKTKIINNFTTNFNLFVARCPSELVQKENVEEYLKMILNTIDDMCAFVSNEIDPLIEKEQEAEAKKKQIEEEKETEAKLYFKDADLNNVDNDQWLDFFNDKTNEPKKAKGKKKKKNQNQNQNKNKNKNKHKK